MPRFARLLLLTLAPLLLFAACQRDGLPNAPGGASTAALTA
jgi:hypothetical protein